MLASQNPCASRRMVGRSAVSLGTHDTTISTRFKVPYVKTTMSFSMPTLTSSTTAPLSDTSECCPRMDSSATPASNVTCWTPDSSSSTLKWDPNEVMLLKEHDFLRGGLDNAIRSSSMFMSVLCNNAQ